MAAFELPSAVKKRALSFGLAGEMWLAGLPDLVTRLANQWEFEPGEILAGGSEAPMLAASLRDGVQAVLKVSLPGSADTRAKSLVFDAAGGRGYAKLYAHDEVAQALLFERLGRPLADAGLSGEASRAVICALLRESWHAPLADVAGSVMSGSEKPSWFASFIKST